MLDSLPEGPKNLTMNSLSPPRIVTSCLLSILQRESEINIQSRNERKKLRLAV